MNGLEEFKSEIMLFISLVLFVVLLVLFKVYAVLTLGRCTSTRKLDGKTVLVTGANRGIGYYTALDLAKRGARVIITSENKEAIKEAREKLIKASGNSNIVAKYLDLLSLDIVRAFAKDILETEKRLDILVNNAGTTGLGRKLTKDGLLPGMQVNYFGPFLLTNLLLGLLKKSGESRIVNVASVLSQVSYGFNVNNINECASNISYELQVYCNSKRCVYYATVEMADRLIGSGVTVNCLHPGAVNTIIYNTTKINSLILLVKILAPLYFKTPEEGAQTSIHLAVSDSVYGVRGRYFSDCNMSNWWGPKDKHIRQKVWDQSVQLVKLSPEEMHFD